MLFKRFSHGDCVCVRNRNGNSVGKCFGLFICVAFCVCVRLCDSVRLGVAVAVSVTKRIAYLIRVALHQFLRDPVCPGVGSIGYSSAVAAVELGEGVAQFRCDSHCVPAARVPWLPDVLLLHDGGLLLH